MSALHGACVHEIEGKKRNSACGAGALWRRAPEHESPGAKRPADQGKALKSTVGFLPVNGRVKLWLAGTVSLKKPPLRK